MLCAVFPSSFLGAGKGEHAGGSLLFVIQRTMQSSSPGFFCAEAGLSVEQAIIPGHFRLLFCTAEFLGY